MYKYHSSFQKYYLIRPIFYSNTTFTTSKAIDSDPLRRRKKQLILKFLRSKNNWFWNFWILLLKSFSNKWKYALKCDAPSTRYFRNTLVIYRIIVTTFLLFLQENNYYLLKVRMMHVFWIFYNTLVVHRINQYYICIGNCH